MPKPKIMKTLVIVTVSLAAIQLLRFGFGRLCYLFVTREAQTDHIINGIFFILALVVMLVALRKRNIHIHMLPDLSKTWAKVGYAIATVITLLLMVLGMLLTGQANAEAIMILIYGTIFTPLFEEVLFRGIVWNRLEETDLPQWAIFITVTILFGLWHLGYVDSIAWRIDGNLLWAMTMKVIVGLAVGVLTGLARWKSKSVYPAILAHAIWNTFGR